MPAARGKPSSSLTRSDVLKAAEALIREQGMEALSMRRLAEILGTSYQVIYSRVGGKGDIARALHDDGFARISQPMSFDSDPGTEAHIIALAHHYRQTAESHPELFELMFGAPIKEFARDEVAREIEKKCFRQTWVRACRTWLEQCPGQRPRGSAVRLAWRLWTAIHGLTVLHIAGHPSPSGNIRAETEAMVRRLLAEPID